MKEDISRAFAASNDLTRNVVSRGTLSLVDDSGKLQILQVEILEDEVIDGAERFQNYGFTARPFGGAEALVVFVGADRSHPVAVAVDDRRFRKNDLQPGEVAVYTDEGDYIHFKRGRTIEVLTENALVNTKTATVNAEESVLIKTKNYVLEAVTAVFRVGSWALESLTGGTTTATMKANIEQEGWHTSTGDQVSGTISQQGHVHSGVQSGSSNSGPPVGGA